MSRFARHLLLVVLLVSGSRVSLATTRQWDFNGTLIATNFKSLAIAGAQPPDGAASVAFEAADTDGDGNAGATVARISGSTHFRLFTALAPNGGGDFVNQYTIIVDMQVPDRNPDCSGTWVSIYQTNTGNSNDGDMFVNPAGGLGISGDYDGCVDAGWHRIALVVDTGADVFRLFLDGTLVNEVAVGGLDGRWSLFSANDGDSDGIILFGDNDGDVPSEILVNSFQIRDSALSDEEIEALGGPEDAGLPVPPLDDPALFLLEGFNNFASDADVVAAGWQIVDANTPVETSTWTITNPGGRANPPTLDGTPSIGGFMISDSDAGSGSNPPGSGMSHDLITPSFSTEGSDTVWLHADVSAQLNDNGEAIFDIDVSTDGGASWTNVFRRIAPGRTAEPLADTTNTDGYFGRLDVDISAVAGDAADVAIRFRHFEPNDDWWIAIDNVQVDSIAPPSGGDCAALSLQDFTGGLGAMSVVSAAGNSGTETWHTTDKGGRYTPGAVSGRGVNRLNHPGADPDFAILDSDANPDPAEDEFLVTPSLNLSTYTQVFLHFKSETVVNGDVQEVLLSLDGGETFESAPIFSYTTGALFDRGEEPYYAERIFSVPEAAGEASVAFAFHWVGQDDWWWAIDDVIVTGTTEVCDPCDCGLRGFGVSFNALNTTVTGSWNGLGAECAEGYVVEQGGRTVAELGPDATSFTDDAPPAGGQDVSYTLLPIIGGSADRECVSNEIDTLVCPSGLSCSTDQVAKTVDLSWDPGVNLGIAGFKLFLDGVELETLAPDASSFSVSVDDETLQATGGILEFELAVFSDPAAPPDCSPLTCRAVLSTGNVAFADDFESYASDAALELAGYFIQDENDPVEDSTWTIGNPGGRSNPPTFDGRPSTGQFVISDSDAQSGSNAQGSGMSHDLWSPEFTVPDGDGGAWLHMDVTAQLNNNGTAVFDVDVSTDGGLNWVNVFRRVAPCRRDGDPCGEMEGIADIEPDATNDNADGFFGRLDIDLSAFAGQTARFRLRHFEPDFDWFIGVDNIIVDDVAPPSGGEITFFEESFDTGLGAMTAVSLADPPNTGAETWSTIDKATRFVRGQVDQRAVNRLEHGRGGDLFGAVLDGAQEAPDPVETDATGKARFIFDPDTNELSYEITFEGLSSPESNAHIHRAPAGTPGPVLYPLPAGSPKIGTITVADVDVASLLAGDLYVNIHSENFRAGEIRGQILPSLGFAILESDANPDPREDEWLVTPELDLSGASEVFFHWDSETVVSGDVQEVLVSIDGGETYLDPIFSYRTGALVDTGEEPFFARRVFRVPTAAGQSSVVFAFHWVGQDDWWWAVDNVRVTGNPTPPPGGRQVGGDCNQDGLVDISDAVCLFGFLFLGNPVELPCGDGSVSHPANVTLFDWNGDGQVDISDGIAELGWLFLGQAPHPTAVDGEPACILVEDCPDVVEAPSFGGGGPCAE